MRRLKTACVIKRDEEIRKTDKEMPPLRTKKIIMWTRLNLLTQLFLIAMIKLNVKPTVLEHNVLYPRYQHLQIPDRS